MKTMPEIRIDRTKTLVEEPGTGHNRWHPDIPPVIRCEPGDEVILETRDAFDLPARRHPHRQLTAWRHPAPP
jgi:acetamidase/formamidase